MSWHQARSSVLCQHSFHLNTLSCSGSGDRHAHILAAFCDPRCMCCGAPCPKRYRSMRQGYLSSYLWEKSSYLWEQHSCSVQNIDSAPLRDCQMQ